MGYSRSDLPQPVEATSVVLGMVQAVRTGDTEALAHLVADPELRMIPVLLESIKLLSELADEYRVPPESPLRWACLASGRSS